MNRKTTVALFLSIVVSGVALYLAFLNVPITELVSYLASINTLWIFPAVFVVLVSFALRALRWKIILDSTCKIGFWQTYHPMMIGFMINSILPGRVCEIARPAILRKKEGVPFTAGLATVADSFAAVEQRIDREERLSWDELKEVLDRDFEDAEKSYSALALSHLETEDNATAG